MAAPVATPTQPTGLATSRTIPLTFRAGANVSFDFVRPPRIRVASELRTPLGECTLLADQAKCEIALPYANVYVITLDDATNPERERTFRVDAPWETKTLHVDSLHQYDETLLWWRAVNVTVDTNEVAEGVALSANDRNYFIENTLESDVWAFGSLRFFSKDDDAWSAMRVRRIVCNMGRSEERGVRVQPGATERVSLDTLGYPPPDPLPEGPYRVEQLVEIVRAPGEDVDREASSTRVPIPAVFERRFARVEIETLEGWM